MATLGSFSYHHSPSFRSNLSHHPEPNAQMESDRCFIGASMEREGFTLPLMRQMCDIFLRPHESGGYGGSYTYLDPGYFDVNGYAAEFALKVFNAEKKTNFKRVKLIKYNIISTTFHCLTFEAKEDETEEPLVFRALVNFTIDDEVLLCEIKKNKDLGKDIFSIVGRQAYYTCLKHELGECYFNDGYRATDCYVSADGSSRRFVRPRRRLVSPYSRFLAREKEVSSEPEWKFRNI